MRKEERGKRREKRGKRKEEREKMAGLTFLTSHFSFLICIVF
jgi:hypothetical protein